MQPKPHIQAHIIAGAKRVHRTGAAAYLVWQSQYNNINLRNLKGHKRFNYLID